MSAAAPVCRGIHTRVLGAGAPGRPAVLVHGLGVSSRYMLPLARALAPRRPVYAPDLPGFGRSDGPPPAMTPRAMAQLLEEWMDAAGLADAIVVGHSLGCQTAAHLAVAHPAGVNRPVLLAPTFDVAARHPVRQGLRWLASMPWERPAIVPVLVREYLDARTWRTVATLRLGLRDHIEGLLPQVRAPVLVVRGARDPVVPDTWATRLAGVAADGRLRTVPGRGHAGNFSGGGAVAALVDAFATEGNDGG